MEIANPTPEDLQRKLYFLVEQLQHMAGELPPKYQMRLPYELLSGLANSLLNDTIFEIVKGLMEIQHVTEKHLFQQRLQLINQQKIEVQEALSAFGTDEEKAMTTLILQDKHKSELKQTDMKLVLQLDQKVADQQSILEKAGVPGFYVTNSPMEIQVQMRLCDFIIRLSKMEIPSWPLEWSKIHTTIVTKKLKFPRVRTFESRTKFLLIVLTRNKWMKMTS